MSYLDTLFQNEQIIVPDVQPSYPPFPPPGILHNSRAEVNKYAHISIINNVALFGISLIGAIIVLATNRKFSQASSLAIPGIILLFICILILGAIGIAKSTNAMTNYSRWRYATTKQLKLNVLNWPYFAGGLVLFFAELIIIIYVLGKPIWQKNIAVEKAQETCSGCN